MDKFEQLKKIQESIEKKMPHFQKMMDKAEGAMKLLTPKQSREVKVDGIQCVFQLFDGRVTIVFPNAEASKEFYTSYPKKISEDEAIKELLSLGYKVKKKREWYKLW